MDTSQVIERRFATQHLTGDPISSADYVREALAVQSQDPGTARWSIGMRADCDDAAVRAVIDSGEIVRAHVLRPTWHYVHRDDLAWLQELLGEKVASSMPARHRQLGLTNAVVDQAFGILQRELAGTWLTRKQLQPLLPTTDAPHGQVVGHLLMLAELRGLICSGPHIGNEHSYRLCAEALPTLRPDVDAQDATRELVRRFFTSHGPASVKDLARWCALTLTQIRNAVAELPELSSVEVDGVELWFDPTQPTSAEPRQRQVFLLPTFDEVFLTYVAPNFPRSPGNPFGDRPASFNESGGGLVVVDRYDVGVWKRSLTKDRMRLTLDVDQALDANQRDQLTAEAEQLKQFAGASTLEVEIS